MAALTASRNTPRTVTPRFDSVMEFRGDGATTFFQGGIVAIETTTGRVAPAITATTLICVGRKGLGDQTTVAASESIEVESGIFKFANSGGDPIPITQEGQDCFIEDDQTVAATDGTSTRSRAGIVYKVETDGVWVIMGLGL
jgi:hypothetical protein